MFAGFSVGGADWPKPELIGVTDPPLRRRLQKRVAFEEAAITHRLGGNIIRVFFGVAPIFRDAADNDIKTVLGAHLFQPGLRPVYVHSQAERVAVLDECDRLLDQLLAGVVQERNNRGAPLNFDDLDDYVSGVEQYNADKDVSQHVRLLLTLVALPPRWILEAPANGTLNALSRVYSFGTLWQRYLLLHIMLLRLMVRRFVTQRDGAPEASFPAVVAFEIGNEPDYEWIPDEMRIERSYNPHANPVGKYVTELHLPQIPESDVGFADFEGAPWGYQAQDAEWHATSRSITPILDFRWGDKLDWYVRWFADFHEHVSYAVRDEAAKAGARLTVVSGGVTHNNLDYLIRMDRANPNAFTYVDRIALHPYHWPAHDIWNSDFVSANDTAAWVRSSPREFARAYFKRFDFLREAAKLVRAPHTAYGRGFFGKKLWITEFGIPTKKLGAHNTPIKEYTRFIRERREPHLPDGLKSAVWEDLWDAFFDQVTPEFLRDDNEVEAFLFYTLREAGMPHFDKDDNDRSNFSLSKRDGSPRMEERTFRRFAHFMSGMTGRSTVQVPSVAVSKSLHGEPWLPVKLPDDVSKVMTMLSTSERALLYWLGRNYYSGAGKIVDGGCFAGGSTLSLGRGLLDAGYGGKGALIHVYDLFTADSYMVENYFTPAGVTCRDGESFRALFDANTRPVASLLQVNQGDVREIRWTGEPIEILFIDISKHWTINDVLLSDFFSCLIPGQSVVVQQDFVFEWCPWIAVTMEYFAAYFEFIGFVEYCSTVYQYKKKIPNELLQTRLFDLPIERKIELIERAISRFSGYPQGVLECAKAALLIEGRREKEAMRHLQDVRLHYAQDSHVLRAVASVEKAAREVSS